MKYTIVALLSCFLALEATPLFNQFGLDDDTTGIGTGLGIGSDLGSGIDDIGTDIGTGIGTGMLNGIGTGMGTGVGTGMMNDNFAHGGQYGAQSLTNGESGLGLQAAHIAGVSNFHNIGSHHTSKTSINHVESDETHNIGGSTAFDQAALAGGGFNRYQKGASQFGNNYGAGNQQGLIA
ncbi:putative per-hexamer repeat protein 5 [Colias croceus]|uniref:putative per-hexamer repeat protein 5 n=1 Tax=Colias crocea TaxID=72248 RepID=UPI001E27F6C8|nr:putative per-hexamer repeat protein 5 [Colias croceus]